jgi:hypothetical protein
MENLPCIRATGASFLWGLDDPREVEAMAPRLTLVAESPYHDPATVGRMSWPSRLLFRAWAWLPAFQPIGRLLRYRF